MPTELLRRPLARLLARRRRRARIVAITRCPAPYRSSWWLEHLRVTLADGDVLDMVFKDLGRPNPGSAAERVKPRRVLDPGREPWVYRTVLESLGSGTPSCWGSVPGPAVGRYWLFLERIRGIPLAEVGASEAWEEAAMWLARFHVAMAARPRPAGPLLRHDARLHRWWFRRAVARARDDRILASLQRIEATHSGVVAAVADEPATLVHGEFYPSNVLLEGGRVRPVDWEMAGWGPALLDLAALTAGDWRDDQRSEMLMAYRHAVLKTGAPIQPLDRFLRTFAACRLLLAVQWLGWGRSWTPPPEHRWNWLDEALRCVEALEES